MPECHTCKHNGKGHADCLACSGFGESNHKGRVHVRFDGNPEAERLSAVGVAAEEPEVPGYDGMESARMLLAFLTAMDDFEVLLLMDRCRGTSFAGSARKRQVSRQAVNARLRKAAKKFPWMARFLGLVR